MPRDSFHSKVIHSNQKSWAVLALLALPKAGSTTMRKRVIPRMMHNYTNARGKARLGEENDFAPCVEQRTKISSIARGQRVFAGLVARDPIERFVSGATEVLKSKCSSWLEWRKQHGHKDGSATNGVVTRAMVPGAPKRPNFKLMKECALVDASGGNMRRWNTTEAIEAMVPLVLQDQRDGYGEKHTIAQAVQLLLAPVDRIDAIVRIGTPQLRTDAVQAAHTAAGERLAPQLRNDWAALLRGAGLRDVFFRDSNSRGRLGVSSPSQQLLRRKFTSQDWATYCALYEIDYACLGFERPPECVRSMVRST